MQKEKYVPVSNYQTAIGKLESLMGFPVPDALVTFWASYNLGKINDVTFYGLSSTVKSHHNLLVGLSSVRAMPNFPARAIPVLDKNNSIYALSVDNGAIVIYNMAEETVETTTMSLDALVEASLNDTKVSLEAAEVVPHLQLNQICRFIKSEFEQSDRSYALSLALAYSIEVDSYSDNVLAFYEDYHGERVRQILSAINERALLDLNSATKLTRDIYMSRCEMVRTIPASKPDHLKELDEKVTSKARQLSKFLKELAA